MTWSRFTITWLVTFTLVLAAVAGINAAIDPFNVLGLNRFGIFVSNERVSKHRMIEAHHYDTILIGSSKVASISPLTDLNDSTIFNASFGAALPEEIRDFLLDHARSGQTVLLGLDLYMFNEREFPLQRTSSVEDRRSWRRAQYLLSTRTASYAYETVVSLWSGKEPAILSDGTRNQAADWRKHNALSDVDYRAVLERLRSNNYGRFRYSKARLGVLREISADMAARNVRLVVFINPLNVDVRQLIREVAEPEFQRFLRDVRSIFPQAHDLSGAWPSRQDYYRHDPYHYLPEVGARIVSAILLRSKPSALMFGTPNKRPNH